jgi:hypothetical protein
MYRKRERDEIPRWVREQYEMELFGDMDGEKDGDFYDQPSENNSSKISPIS